MCGGRGTLGHSGVSVTWGSLCIWNEGFTGSWLCLNQIANTLTSDVIKANAGLEAIVQEGSWLNCISLCKPSYSPLLKPTWTAVFVWGWMVATSWDFCRDRHCIPPVLAPQAGGSQESKGWGGRKPPGRGEGH